MAIALDPGTIFAGDYRIVEPLGQGGMGAVYKVEQISTSKPRALKLMHPQLVADANLRRRFEQEARIGAHIASEHVVEVQVAGVDASTGQPYLVMEYLAGDDLCDYVQKRGAVPPAEVHAIFEQLCHAMIAAHAAGIVHRDLKPENVFLARAQRANATFMIKVLDFGIAKLAAEAGSGSTAAMGSPLWMSPEQTERRPITPAADVWALGLMAFHLLTGIHLWRATDVAEPTMTQLLRDILIEPIPLASARAGQRGLAHLIPEGFDAFLARCTAREPAHRFQDAKQMWAALEPMLRAPRGMTAGAPPPPNAYSPYAYPPVQPWPGTPPPFTQSGPTGQPSSSKWWIIVPILLALPLVAGAAVAGLYVMSKRNEETVPPIPSVSLDLDAGTVAIDPTALKAPGDDKESPDKRSSLAWMWEDSGGPVDLPTPTPTSGKTVGKGTFATHKAACDSGDEFECVNVGFDYQRGINGAPQDYSKAATFYKQACDEQTRNGAEGCADLGWLYEMGKGVVKDLSKAQVLYTQGCDLGAKLGCNNLGVMLRDGNGVATDNPKAVKLFDKACTMGDAQGCANLGYMYSKGLGVTQDSAKAVQLYQSSCDKNDPYGCHNLGYRYQQGDGVPKDTAKAATLYRKGCDNGQMDSCVNLGALFEVGDGVALDQAKAVALYQKGCDNSQAHGCQYAATMLRDGKGVTQDLAKAKADFKKGCALGDSVSCTESAKMP